MDNYIAVQAIDGVIVFPKQWTLKEIKEKHIDASPIFKSNEFINALERSGFIVQSDVSYTSLSATEYLMELYDGIEKT
ncbi:hypothetical protein [Paenibacillus amylolyticus]|uniref:hypothetical protein n=1 Tax=Paenibacillus amylolyticus TaxID=1451 RepID=UPI003EBC81E9